MNRLPRDNNPAEIEAFDSVCYRLGGFDERISTEWVDGYLTALAAGPRGLAVADWLPKMAGDAYDRAFADPEDRQQAERALKARFAVLVDQLDAEALYDALDQLRLSPLMQPWDDTARAELLAQGGVTTDELAELVTGAVWAEGFGAAINDYTEAWARADADDEAMALFGDLLEQVRVLLLAEASDELRAHVAATYGDEAIDRNRLIDEACYAVQDLHLWWVDHAPRPLTRRVEKTPGRNDPCACGSGKKFKKCHGAAA